MTDPNATSPATRNDPDLAPRTGPSDEEILTSVAARIVRMQLAAPAIFFLESSKPLSYVGSQALVFFEPFVKSILNVANYDRFVALLEERGSIERLLVRIEELDQETRDTARAEKNTARAEKNTARAAKKAAQETTPPTRRRSRWDWFRRGRGRSAG